MCAYHNIPPPVSRPNFKISHFFFIFFSSRILTLSAGDLEAAKNARQSGRLQKQKKPGKIRLSELFGKLFGENQRLENWGARRAALRPYLFLSNSFFILLSCYFCKSCPVSPSGCLLDTPFYLFGRFSNRLAQLQYTLNNGSFLLLSAQLLDLNILYNCCNLLTT